MGNTAQEMPKARNIPRKKATWTVESLQAAMQAVKDGHGKRKSAREFGIPYSTLKDRLKTNNSSVAQLGRHSTFSPEQEAELEERCIYLAKMFYGLTAMDLRRLVYDFAQANNVPHCFNHEKKMAGKDWLQLFLRRHPRLSMRKPEPTSLGRISGFNKNSVNLFFKNLEEVQTKYNFAPNRIYNVDETGVTTVQVPSKIVSPKGVKQLGKAVSWERGRNITVCCAISATGIYIPPMFIYPRTRMSDLLKRNGPVGATYECSAKGWMNEELFLKWTEHFRQHSAASKENPVLLLLDNHSSHCSLATYEFCRQNGIIMLSFPPHTSHKLQPLDLTVFGPLKTAYSNECSLFMRQNIHRKITPYDVAEIFNRAFIRIATMEKAQKAFQISGIYPYRPNVFSDEDFLPATLSQIPVVEIPACEAEPEPSTSREAEPEPSTSRKAEPQPSTSREAEPEPSTSRKPEPQPSTSREAEPLPSTSCGAESYKKQLTTKANISFQQMSPLCAVQKRALKKPRKLGASKILTATPEKIELEKKEERKVQKNKGKKTKVPLPVKRVTKKVKFDSSSSGSSCSEKELCDDQSSDNFVDIDMEDEVCLICGEFGKSEMWYRCGICHKWAHKECTGFDTFKNFVCDFCS